VVEFVRKPEIATQLNPAAAGMPHNLDEVLRAAVAARLTQETRSPREQLALIRQTLAELYVSLAAIEERLYQDAEEGHNADAEV
jgi:hypothetical protein